MYTYVGVGRRLTLTKLPQTINSCSIHILFYLWHWIRYSIWPVLLLAWLPLAHCCSLLGEGGKLSQKITKISTGKGSERKSIFLRKITGWPQYGICGSLRLDIFYGELLWVRRFHHNLTGDDVHDSGSVRTFDHRKPTLHEVLWGGGAWWASRPKIRLFCDSLWALCHLSSCHISQCLWDHAKPIQHIKPLCLREDLSSDQFS